MIFALSLKKQGNLSDRIICSVIVYLKLTISVVCIPSHKPLVLAMLAAMVTISHQETVRQVANGKINYYIV